MSRQLTHEVLLDMLSYEPETGVFQWNGTGKGRKPGRCGVIDDGGYRTIGVLGKIYKAHRLAWFYVVGRWPERGIDHINGIKDDNRFENLRDVTSMVNAQNRRKAARTNKTGLLGVSRHKNGYRAHIAVNKKIINLGVFQSPEMAHAVYIKAKRYLQPGCTI